MNIYWGGKMSKLVIGKIINTRGIKGEIKIENYSSFIKERYKVGNEVYLSNDEKNFISKKIEHYSYNKGFVYLSLEGITSINEANKYRDWYLYCLDNDLKESKDVYHFLTLKGMKVRFNNEVIGTVIDIENNTKQDLLRIDTGEKTFLVPFLNEFIKEVNKEENYIEFINIEVFYEN